MRSRSTTNRLAVSYVRVSSQEQEREGFSIAAQHALIHRYATRRGLKILREFEDVETAKRAGRRGFTEMVTFLRRTQRCGVLLVEKVDRLSRNLKDWVTLDELNLEIHFIKDNDIYSHASRSTDKLMVGFRMLIAKNFVDNLSEETCKGQQEKAAQGRWPSCAPLGYANTTGPDGKRCIVPDPDRAALIRRLFERYATGRSSLIDLTTWARGEGLVSRKGHVLSKATIHHILRNRIYSGDFDWSGTMYQGNHVPVVSRELWGCVQDILDGRYRARPRRATHDFAFSRLITCGHCGCALVGERKKARYVYYHCIGYRGKCSEPYTREEVLEAEFTNPPAPPGVRRGGDGLSGRGLAPDTGGRPGIC